VAVEHLLGVVKRLPVARLALLNERDLLRGPSAGREQGDVRRAPPGLEQPVDLVVGTVDRTSLSK